MVYISVREFVMEKYDVRRPNKRIYKISFFIEIFKTLTLNINMRVKTKNEQFGGLIPKKLLLIGKDKIHADSTSGFTTVSTNFCNFNKSHNVFLKIIRIMIG